MSNTPILCDISPMDISKEEDPPDEESNLYKRPLPQTCIDFSSREGKTIFLEALASGYTECYFKLSSHFLTQSEPLYCGVSSLVMVLNALEVDPGRIWKAPWRWYHESMIHWCVDEEVVKEKGIDMAQFVSFANCNGLSTDTVYGSDISSLDWLRQEIKRVTQREDVVFIASYSREALGQTGTGHFTPIAGYHEGQDLVLLLDVARFKYPPHWVTLQALYDAMKCIDEDTGKSRGFVLLSVAKEGMLSSRRRPSCQLSKTLKTENPALEIMSFEREGKDG